MIPFISFILHIEDGLISLIQSMGKGVYSVIFGIIFVETGVVIMPFLPGDSLLFTAGALSGQGLLHGGAVALTIIIAAFIGDNTNYAIGRFVGERLLSAKKPWIKRDHLIRAHQLIERYGRNAIIVARFMPIIRTIMPFVAGLTRMKYERFLVYSTLASCLWTLVLVGGGILFGNMPLVKNHMSLIIVAIIIISIMPAVVTAIRARRKSKNA